MTAVQMKKAAGRDHGLQKENLYKLLKYGVILVPSKETTVKTD
jgi:hypothetical protein